MKTRGLRTLFSTTVAELNSFMKCAWFMSASPWMTDRSIRAKNLVTTARTIHLPAQKEATDMISVLRKEACSRKMLDDSGMKGVSAKHLSCGA